MRGGRQTLASTRSDRPIVTALGESRAPLEHTRYAKYLISLSREVAEWSKAAVLKGARALNLGGTRGAARPV